MRSTPNPNVVDPAATDTRSKAEAADMPLPHDLKTIYLGGLFLIAVLVVLFVAREVVLPIVIALVLKLLLQPLVRLLGHIHVPKLVGCLVAVFVLLGVFAGLGAILSGPATEMTQQFPDLLAKAQSRFGAAQEYIRPFLAPFGGGGMENPADMLKGRIGSIAASVAGGASSFASHLLETLLILFYMLMFGETFMRRLVEVLPRFRDKKQAVEISSAVERDISAYLLTITIINAVVGVLAGTIMWFAGIPGAIVWGVIAFVFNYVPIIGPFAGVCLFAVVGLATLGVSWAALLPAAGYLAIHFAEGEAFTPMVLAKRFTLNPIAVMVGLIFWFWMWGVQGAILSVPLLAIVKVVSDRIRPLRALGHLLEG